MGTELSVRLHTGETIGLMSSPLGGGVRKGANHGREDQKGTEVRGAAFTLVGPLCSETGSYLGVWSGL